MDSVVGLAERVNLPADETRRGKRDVITTDITTTVRRLPDAGRLVPDVLESELSRSLVRRLDRQRPTGWVNIDLRETMQPFLCTHSTGSLNAEPLSLQLQRQLCFYRSLYGEREGTRQATRRRWILGKRARIVR